MTPEEIAAAAAAKKAEEEAAAQKADDDAETAKAEAAKKAAEEAGKNAEVPAHIQAELDKARAELKKFQDDDDARKTAELSEVEREKKRASDAEARNGAKDSTIRRLAILQGVREAASDLKIELDMSAVRDLYEARGFEGVKVDENGDPVGLADHLKSLVKTKPYVVKTAALAPDIHAQDRGKDLTPSGELTDERKADINRRFRIHKK